MSEFGIQRELRLKYSEALPRVAEALKEEGFGILTEIDVQKTLREKLGVSFRPYKILGACNPPFAHRALEAELDVGLMLPCNVIVYEGDPGTCVVSAIDPLQTVAARGNKELQEIAAQVQSKLRRAIERIPA
jgi:uncharacterized protein (DUF302 family)